ncbi:MAG: hypothetical protein A2249_00745 [Candidatus Jacksonbacteria bacterium RIFOXYA2_FULL_44_7]|uniref:NYN domain-containing protein n=1 Tax=Candidatus Jacksonbacteria bacterium RIFCSPLOWO2_02_FULL_44_20 TaxID=1798460 RepID=A0A1G2A5T4_9BACT|nr:MAG: hypothetical protein UW39_C0035G0008 [Parcubacteria group bacterium GW2011_GWC2_44_17]OGY69823.1 MAG: hypothetical protein A3C00_04400 [Candidatus Jacksonbacteria bacterium RIFCSPHIGHO2_02_FULL_44_25]OGY72035.1 MAG: hypothetical protein A3E05_03825 [Candidatus Jacksonbacteria bacterium RIFCSPHIGHO2_12_FULL_44_12]OGY72228.1 MAG: hypothetical protein A3H61_04430 [Candidatus Jacksonbacteria bacterium RIFCSPLOWO2_02_FULL_44_20]OGY74843.1 MAG: hypothetical protein A3H07_00180 [Candidatus Jac
MNKKLNNYAYIDSQNLHLGVQSLGWELDYKKFRRYLTEKYRVATAYLFIGYIPENQDLYGSLQKSGYILKFKPVLSNKDGSHKGNVDADMVLQIAIDYYEKSFDKTIIVTSDGDFYSVVKFLYDRGKLYKVISPYSKTCSSLLRNTAREKIVFINNLQKKLEHKKKKHRFRTEP